jgi:hypothetical protein
LDSIVKRNSNSDEKVPDSYLWDYKTYKWLRPGVLFGKDKFKLFLTERINIEHIKQGNLGSCYLLSALAGLAKVFKRIEKVFVYTTVNPQGIYGVKYYKQGIPDIVYIDDHLPVNKGKLAFASMKENEIWLSLIEKAWAKLNKGYINLWYGTPSEAFICLSEAPCFFEFHSKYIQAKSEYLLWNKIIEAQERRWLLSTNTEEAIHGLQANHAYTFLEAYPSLNSKPNLKLIKLRNQNGSSKWTGLYCEQSDNWTSELKEEVGFADKPSGIFYITFEEYISYFPWTYICKYEDGYHYNYLKFTVNVEVNENEFRDKIVYSNIAKRRETDQDLVNFNNNHSLKQILESNYQKDGLLSLINRKSLITSYFEISTPTICSISLHLPQKRFLTQEVGVSKYKTPLAYIILVKLEDCGKYTYINSDFINWEKIILECELQPGKYHIYGKCYWAEPADYELVLSCYSSNKVNLYKLNNNHIPDDWLQQILINIIKRKTKMVAFDKNENNSFYSSFMFDKGIYTGYCGIYIENNSKLGKIISTFNFDGLKGLKPLNLTKNTSNGYRVIVPPQQSELIILKVTDLPWQCKTDYTQEIWFEYPVDYLVHKYLTDSTARKELIPDLVVYKIQYDRGYIFKINNDTEKNYELTFNFENLLDHIIEESEDKATSNNNTYICRVKSGSQHLVNIKFNRQEINQENLIINYTYYCKEY